MPAIRDDNPENQAALERIEDILGEEAAREDEDEAAAAPSPPDEGDDPAPDDPASEEHDEGQPEPGASSAIEAPASFNAELKARFSKLDPETQRTLAQWETDRQKGVNQKLQEAAQEKAQLQPLRQRLEQQLDLAISLAQFDPQLAEWSKRTPDDWHQLALTDKPRYLEEKTAFDAKAEKLSQAMQMRRQLGQTAAADETRAEMTRLVEKAPELADPQKAKAFADDVVKTLKGAGVSEQEIAQLRDHRILLLVRELIGHRTAEAARKAAKTKQATPPAARAQRPGKGDGGAGGIDAKAIRNKVRTAGGSTHEQADALMGFFR